MRREAWFGRLTALPFGRLRAPRACRGVSGVEGLLLACLVLTSCGRGLVRESVGRVTLPRGLELTWPAEPGQAEARAGAPVVLWLRSVGQEPVAVCRVLRTSSSRTRTDEGDEHPSLVFVRAPEPGRFRYDGDSDCIIAEPAGGSPFSLPFRWYDLVLHPGGEEAVLHLGRAESAATVEVLVEYMPLSYRRLARAGYVPPADVGATKAPSEEPEEPAVRFERLSEAELRRRRPSRLFLRSEFLPPVMQGRVEMPAPVSP